LGYCDGWHQEHDTYFVQTICRKTFIEHHSSLNGRQVLLSHLQIPEARRFQEEPSFKVMWTPEVCSIRILMVAVLQNFQ
jgi:hypothetical protein